MTKNSKMIEASPELMRRAREWMDTTAVPEPLSHDWMQLALARFGAEIVHLCAEVADETEKQWVGAGPTVSSAILAKFGMEK